MSNKEIAQKLNRSVNSISSVISKYQIKKKIILFDNEKIKNIFNNRYKITSYGRIFDKMNNEMIQYDHNGYKRITLSPEHKRKKKYFIHRLVAEAFLEKQPGKDFVNHKDLNKSNNHVENLEWVSSSENEFHKFQNKPDLKQHLSKIVSKEMSPEKIKTINEVRKICYEISLRNRTVKEIADEFNTTSKRINAIKNKRLWKNISDEYF